MHNRLYIQLVRRQLADVRGYRKLSSGDMLVSADSLATAPPARVPAAAVFMTAQPLGVPVSLVHNVRVNTMLHEQAILLTLSMAQTPHLSDDECLVVAQVALGIVPVRTRHGFMEEPNVPSLFTLVGKAGVPVVELGVQVEV